MELDVVLRNKVANEEVQKEGTNSNEQQQLVVFYPVLHEHVIEENASESMRKEGDPDEGLLADAVVCTPKQVDAKELRMTENMENLKKIIAQVAKGEKPDFISARKQWKKPSANGKPRIRCLEKKLLVIIL
ncbi:OLC1v1036375C1 [Oldenlandia corymbosa var. corymbosa]|uniref:OLC1v1036375C1 n=1 Tax=Oldenlandia corymbosa var. corymbosa TaxID=529605 RepID=A0AAV1CV85_OLDCO|nr:OLC1v1036375C1 [Oldenlandia corymbosa var. corymbosa]